jgi:hypothetical protein
MAIDANKANLINGWLRSIVHTTPMPKGEGWSTAKDDLVLANYCDFLYADFTNSAAIFVTASAAAIAGQNESFPSYPVLKAQLTAWWDEHKPRVPPPTGQESDGLSEMERTSIKLWTEMSLAGRTREALAIRLGVLRRYVDRAYQWLIGNDKVAMSIAREHGWEAPASTGADFTEAGTREILHELRDHPHQRSLLAAYRSLLTGKAPQFLPMLDAFEAEIGHPAAAGPTPASQDPTAAAVAAAWKPKPVEPATLAEMRKAAAIHLPAEAPKETTS